MLISLNIFSSSYYIKIHFFTRLLGPRKQRFIPSSLPFCPDLSLYQRLRRTTMRPLIRLKTEQNICAIWDKSFFPRPLIHLLCLILLIAPLLSTAGEGKNYNQGAFYFAQGDYITAFNIWLPLAKQAEPDAQYSVGLLYDQGKGVSKDTNQGLKYIQLASEQGLPAAQYYLGIKYYAGIDIDRDTTKARQLLIQAAKQDHLPAQFQLAIFYAEGEGGPQDQQQATYWLSKASESGYSPAQHSLAARFLTGKGTALDVDRGIFWLKKAADQHDTDALRDLGFMYFQGMGVDKDYQQAHNFLLLPAEDGSAMALFLLGEIYTQGGYGVDKDTAQAEKWYRQAQSLGFKKASERLQQLSGKKSKSDFTKAEKTTPPEIKENAQKEAYLSPGNLSLKKSSKQFKQIKDSYYAIQILSARLPGSITRLTEQFYDEQTYVLKTKKDKDSVFILVYGSYAGYTDAKHAIDTLPKIFQLKSKPWIRQVKSIKPLITED